MKKTLTLSAAAAFGIAGSTMARGLDIDISGLTSNGFQNANDGNATIAVGLGVGFFITEIGYDINATGVGVSWFEEMTYSLWDGPVGGTLIADGSSGALSYAPGAQTSFFVNTTASGVHDIVDYMMTTDTLTIELHEWSFDDVVGPDAIYNEGSVLTIPIPAPAGLAAIGVLGLVRRRLR